MGIAIQAKEASGQRTRVRLQAVRALVKQITEECEANLSSRMVTGVSCSILEQACLSY